MQSLRVAYGVSLVKGSAESLTSVPQAGPWTRSGQGIGRRKTALLGGVCKAYKGSIEGACPLDAARNEREPAGHPGRRSRWRSGAAQSRTRRRHSLLNKGLG